MPDPAEAATVPQRKTLEESRRRAPAPRRPPPPPRRIGWRPLAAIAGVAAVIAVGYALHDARDATPPELVGTGPRTTAAPIRTATAAPSDDGPEVTALRTYLEELELRIADLERDTRPQRDALVSARTSLELARMFLRDGGVNGGCDGCKAMPGYRRALARWPHLAARVAALEQRIGHCTFGYKQPGGAITPPDPAWTADEADAIVARSVQHDARCWLTGAGDSYWP